MNKRILVTGKNGQLGQSLQKIAQARRDEFEFHFVGRDELDLSAPSSIEAFFRSICQPYYAIINTAAYTAVDKAESEKELANQVNHLAVKQLAEIAKAQGSVLLHVSTDYVFNGRNFRPYIETDEMAPVNHYGATKLLGEQAMQECGCQGAIVRTSWVYSEFGNNFVKTMLRLAKERDELGVIFDQVGTPTYATDLAEALLAVLRKHAAQSVASGVQIYHYSNEGVCSWYDFALATFELAKLSCKVKPIETVVYPTPAKRPHFSLLNKAKIKDTLGLNIPYWRSSLSSCVDELLKG